jgi:putative transposase
MHESSPAASRWHHAPLHLLVNRGVFMVTAGTFRKERFFNSPEKLDRLTSLLRTCAEDFQWRLQAWAVFANHYHFIAQSPDEVCSLKRFLSKLHMLSAKAVNSIDGCSGRRVWSEYWETRIRYEKSYLARLNYVNQNPVKHGLVSVASQYRWSSASSFAAEVGGSFAKMVATFPTDRLMIRDAF